MMAHHLMALSRLRSYQLNTPDGKQLPTTISHAENDKDSPIVIVFHGWTGGLNVKRDFDTKITPAHPDEFPTNWNIVLPQDRYGLARCGSWWLGEKGDFFVLKLLDNLVTFMRGPLGFRGDIYTFGTSMGGFGALLHGLRWQARAIVANVPQVRLLAGDWAGLNVRPLRSVFGAETLNTHMAGGELSPEQAGLMRYADATNFINPSLPANRRPTLLIAQSRYDITRDYAREHCFALVNKLLDHDFTFELHTYPELSHREHIGLIEALRWFEEKKVIIENGIQDMGDLQNDTSVRYAETVLAQYALEHDSL